MKLISIFLLLGILGFTAVTSPESFSSVGIASMPVLAVFAVNEKGGIDKKK